MKRKGRPRNANGSIFQRADSARWWMRYQDKKGTTIRESTGTADREEAERMLRERLAARDEGTLSSLLSGKVLTFNEWADWFLENRSQPPIRAEATHQAHLPGSSADPASLRKAAALRYQRRVDRGVLSQPSSIPAKD